MSSFCVSLDVNFNESLTNDVVSFEQLGPVFLFPEDNLSKYQWIFTVSHTCIDCEDLVWDC